MTPTAALTRARARIGMVLNGKYRLDHVLGVGGMAVVYEVTHRNQKRFALKMLHAELSVHEDIRRRFLREGYAANTLNHPGALAVIDDDTAEDGSAFLVMELLDGRPLDEILKDNERRLSGEAVLSVAEQLLDVLVVAHDKGVVHRDLKPANLFVTRDGSLKVLDFGIARLQDVSNSSQATHTGVMLGTPAYMPPEQALAQASQIDEKTDLWSVGATLFTLLSGANVHPGENATQILVNAASKPARSVKAVAPWVDDRVAGFVDHALAFDKKDRWPNAAAMRDAARKVHEEVFGSPPSRAVLAAFIGPGERKFSNPEPFVASGSSSQGGGSAPRLETPPRPRAPSAPEIIVLGSASAQGTGAAMSSPLAKTVAAEEDAAAPGAHGSSVAFSTAKPISSDEAPVPRPAPSSRATRWVAAGVVALGAVALFVAVRRGGAASGGSTPAAPPDPASAAMIPPPATPPSATPPAGTASSQAPTPAPSATPDPVPSAAPPASAASPSPPQADRRPSPPVPARSAAPKGTASAAPSARPAPAARPKAPTDDDLFHP